MSDFNLLSKACQGPKYLLLQYKTIASYPFFSEYRERFIYFCYATSYVFED